MKKSSLILILPALAFTGYVTRFVPDVRVRTYPDVLIQNEL